MRLPFYLSAFCSWVRVLPHLTLIRKLGALLPLGSVFPLVFYFLHCFVLVLCLIWEWRTSERQHFDDGYLKPKKIKVGL